MPIPETTTYKYIHVGTGNIIDTVLKAEGWVPGGIAERGTRGSPLIFEYYLNVEDFADPFGL